LFIPEFKKMVQEVGLFAHRFSAHNLRKSSKKQVIPSRSFNPELMKLSKRVIPSPLFSPEFKKMVEEAGLLAHRF
jgi:hypothetical protein